jgi:signal recognition particle subunit SRP54
MFESMSEKFSGIMRSFQGKSKISEKNIEDAVDEIKVALLDADVNLRVVRRFINGTREEALGEKVLKAVDPGQQFTKIVYDRMVKLLGSEEGEGELKLKGPDVTSTILMMGLQGSGKTTTSAKLALRLKKSGRRPLMIAADLVRPAAITQLQVLGTQIDIPVFTIDGCKDPVKVAKEGLAYAKKNQFDTIIVDTSGRMHLDDILMSEIQNVSKAINPDETLFVADAMTGQNAVTIAKEFESKVGISGVILSKFDSDTRGGAALSLRSVVGKPIKFIGVGEKMEDLDPFYPERIASRILGMGDVVSLVEKAQETIDEADALKLQEKMKKNIFDLQDYLDQLRQMDKMGSMDKILEMIPGAAGNISADDIPVDELKKERAIILSMTPQERQNYRLLGLTRRKRIAKGSGSTVAQVNKLIKKFEKLKKTMQKMTKNKKYQKMLKEQMGY